MTLQTEQKLLREILAEMLYEPKPASSVQESLLARGFTIGQIKQAKKRLNVKSKKTYSNGWIWELPA